MNGKMMDVGKEKLIWMYMKMLEMRLFEERIVATGVPLDKWRPRSSGRPQAYVELEEVKFRCQHLGR